MPKIAIIVVKLVAEADDKPNVDLEKEILVGLTTRAVPPIAYQKQLEKVTVLEM